MKAISGKVFARLLERRGWDRMRITGSHYIFAKPGADVRLSVPIHGNKPLKIGWQRHLMKLAEIEEQEL